MTAELDRLPASWMRRSRRARVGLRKFKMQIEASSPPEERPKVRRLWLFLAFLSAAIGIVFLGEALWIKAKAGFAQVLLERAFAQSIATGHPVKPWSWADTWPIARISVPRLKVSAIALASGSGQSLAFGPGHLDGTPRPGERGTAVFAAHRDTHFRFLGDLKPGDEITVTRDDGITFTYEMTGAEVVRWDQSDIDAKAGGFNLALATCWPIDGMIRGALRYVVHARLKPVAMFGSRYPQNRLALATPMP
jgi:sortase A